MGQFAYTMYIVYRQQNIMLQCSAFSFPEEEGGRQSLTSYHALVWIYRIDSPLTKTFERTSVPPHVADIHTHIELIWGNKKDIYSIKINLYVTKYYTVKQNLDQSWLTREIWNHYSTELGFLISWIKPVLYSLQLFWYRRMILWYSQINQIMLNHPIGDSGNTWTILKPL